MMHSKVLPRCQCCQEVPAEGLYDGIRIQGVLFCSHCCHRLIMTPAGSPFYEKFLSGIRGVLFPGT